MVLSPPSSVGLMPPGLSTHGPGRWMVIYAFSSYLLPLQIAEGAALGLAVPCAVTVGVGLTVTPSVDGAIVWTATQGPLAGKVSQVPRGRTEHFSAPGQEPTPCPNTNTK